jgi:methyl-accepting chemotaxis protein
MIDEILSVIELINAFRTTDSVAVEQLSVTTSEMNRNVSEASEGSLQIAADVSTGARAAEVARAEVTEARSAATAPADLSKRPQTLVGRFRC